MSNLELLQVIRECVDKANNLLSDQQPLSKFHLDAAGRYISMADCATIELLRRVHYATATAPTDR